MSTINPPTTFAATQGDLGYDFVFAEQAILDGLKSRFALIGTALASLMGDVGGSGSDKIRVTHWSGAGFDVAMDALATETSAITPKAFDTGYAEVTVGYYGLGHSESYFHQALSREPGVSLDRLIEMVPASWNKTMNGLICTVGSGFTGTTVGSTSTELDIEDLVDLATIYEETDGAFDRGMPLAALAPQQLTQAKKSAAAHPAYQNSITEFASVAGMGAIVGDQAANFLGLGFSVLRASDVVTSGGAYRGFSVSPGGIGWARASTSPIQTANPGRTMYMPQFGLIIEELTTGGPNGVRIYNARSIVGVAAGAASHHVQVGILSTT